MLILEHARRAVLLSVLALTGTAAAQGTPGTMNDDTTTTPTTPTTTTDDTITGDTSQPQPEPAPQTTDTDVHVTSPDINVTTPPPVVVNNEPTYVVSPQPTTTYDTDEDETMLERYGIAVALGGGVEGFTDD
nr:hypothetical protein [Deltaproteobacteria bacterium]